MGKKANDRSLFQMSDEETNKRSEADEQLQKEIRKDRPFTLAEAIGRLAGPGIMKGASPVSRMRQAELEIEAYLKRELSNDSCGALRLVLLRHVIQSENLQESYDQPLAALASYLQRVLGSEYLLKEHVGEADVEWGRLMGERPVFEREGRPPQPDDPYTMNSVRIALSKLAEKPEMGARKDYPGPSVQP